ncbi:hypothetical protein [Glaciihabitans sp. dw_435]|uniref:hypothetical protein n=1 Tax=Glaciihabitans sp. dw_435 TaxID=2720081 RepID=UPI001BD1E2BE|nr:hypothetical protein [Glaciihabitans sp. dw_435]
MAETRDDDEYDAWVIGLREYWGSGVVWSPEDDRIQSPVEDEGSGLSAELIDHLRWWRARVDGTAEQASYQSPPGMPFALFEAGRVLAQRIADEVGEEFTVELSFEGRMTRVRAARRARNPEARDFFAARARAAAADRRYGA